MSGNCDTCAKKNTCKAVIGIMFGFCNTDYEPIKKDQKKKEDVA